MSTHYIYVQKDVTDSICIANIVHTFMYYLAFSHFAIDKSGSDSPDSIDVITPPPPHHVTIIEKHT
jgi:hypothetical protein